MIIYPDICHDLPHVRGHFWRPGQGGHRLRRAHRREGRGPGPPPTDATPLGFFCDHLVITWRMVGFKWDLGFQSGKIFGLKFGIWWDDFPRFSWDLMGFNWWYYWDIIDVGSDIDWWYYGGFIVKYLVDMRITWWYHEEWWYSVFFPQQRKLRGSSAQNSSGVHWCRRRVRFNEVPEKVPEEVPEKVWEALVHSQVKFNRLPEKVPEKVPGSLGAKPSQVQQGSGEGSGRLWCRARSGSTSVGWDMDCAQLAG